MLREEGKDQGSKVPGLMSFRPCCTPCTQKPALFQQPWGRAPNVTAFLTP